MEKQKITDEIREKLRASFPSDAYKAHPTKSFLTTLKAMYVTERLNDIFGVGRWTIEIEIIERTEDYVLVQGEFHSLDFDITLPKQFGGHKTSGKGTEIADGFKSAFTDCQSKIASYLEIGIDMFKGLINPPKNNNNTTEETTGKRKIDTWLSEDQFNKACDSSVKGINATLKKYNGQSGFGMKKEYRIELQGILKKLEEIENITQNDFVNG